MSETIDFSSQDSLEHLPPIEHAPILEKLATLGIRRFKNEYALETPVDPDTGIVDHTALIAMVSAEVDPDYRWHAPFFDEHHMQWFGSHYASSFNYDAGVSKEFRDQATNKLWVPRQFHNFLHAITIPADVPSYEQMRTAVKDFRRKDYIYRVSQKAIQLTERQLRVRRIENGEDIMYFDPDTNRFTRDVQSLEHWRKEFIHQIEHAHKKGLLDLSDLSIIDLVDSDSIAERLPEIRDLMMQGIQSRNGKTARQVDVPYRQAA